jgi:hypothetical protein
MNGERAGINVAINEQAEEQHRPLIEYVHKDQQLHLHSTFDYLMRNDIYQSQR